MEENKWNSVLINNEDISFRCYVGLLRTIWISFNVKIIIILNFSRLCFFNISLIFQCCTNKYGTRQWINLIISFLVAEPKLTICRVIYWIARWFISSFIDLRQKWASRHFFFLFLFHALYQIKVNFFNNKTGKIWNCLVIHFFFSLKYFTNFDLFIEFNYFKMLMIPLTIKCLPI